MKSETEHLSRPMKEKDQWTCTYLTGTVLHDDHIFFGPPKRQRHLIQCEGQYEIESFYCNTYRAEINKRTISHCTYIVITLRRNHGVFVWKMKARESRIQKHESLLQLSFRDALSSYALYHRPELVKTEPYL
ncbi:hypothetical protein SEVIR_7G255201v4 [Setaria viridis]